MPTGALRRTVQWAGEARQRTSHTNHPAPLLQAERLREWYLTMLDTAVRRGIAERVVFMADDFFPSAFGA